jgi:protocatechuate 3,4-dioxygenase alpha subunit
VSGLTPFQTIGPFFEVLLRRREPCLQISEGAEGLRIRIHGALADGDGRPIADGLIETWQADARGRYRHPDDPRPADADPAFQGYGWCHTDAEGRFEFETVKPGAVAAANGRMQAPHVLVSVMARGVLTRYVTRIYFEDEAANAGDPVLALVPPGRRDTLIAGRVEPGVYRFDIRVQGGRETVFFDVE